ncbi:MAG: c-type cytochrome [Chloroflexi bacterium]|nr:c-type cytochrome [Chloroflexota bacterium]
MSTQIKILVGLLFTFLTCLPIAVVTYNDLGRDLGMVGSTQKSVIEQRADALSGRQIEVGADLFSQFCIVCHGKKGEGISGVAPALNRKDLYDGRYLKQIAWGGNAQTFLKDTVSGGRPVQSRPDLYAAKMPTWSNQFGGPMRPDQVDSLVSFLLNWKDQAPEINAWPPAGTPRPTPTLGPTPTPNPATANLHPYCQNVPASFQGKTAPYKPDDKAALAAGKTAFESYCAACHGLGGRGDGVAASALNPKPANFTDKEFMQKIPLDCHFYLVSESQPGSQMPPWKALGEDTIWKVLIYERNFSQ